MKIIATRAAAFVAIVVLTGFGQRPAFAADRVNDLGSFEFKGHSIQLPLSGHGIHPLVAIDIGDGELVPFVVDTGASVNVIDSAIAKALGLEVLGDIEIGAPGGPQIPAQIVKVPLFRVGDAIIRDAEFVTQDIAAFSGGLMHGVLGLGLFSDYLLTFDQSNGHIKVSRDKLVAGGDGVMAYVSPDAHIQIEIDVAGTAMSAHVDTGSMGTFMLPGKLVDLLPLTAAPKTGGIARVVGGDREIKLGQLQGQIGFADLQYDNPVVSFITPSFGHGNVGSGILSELVVSVDQKNSLIAFRQTDKKSVVASNNKRQIGIQLRGVPGGSALNIIAVVPGSLGEQAGFESGDAITAINDKLIAAYQMPELADLLGGSDPLTFTLDRNDETTTISIH